MADVKWADVAALTPTLSALSTETQDAILAFANTYYNASQWGGVDSVRYKMLRTLLAAHLGTMSQWGGVSGRITSKTISSSSDSVTFASRLVTDALDLTEWGQMIALLFRGNATLRMPRTW